MKINSLKLYSDKPRTAADSLFGMEVYFRPTSTKHNQKCEPDARGSSLTVKEHRRTEYCGVVTHSIHNTFFFLSIHKDSQDINQYFVSEVLTDWGNVFIFYTSAQSQRSSVTAAASTFYIFIHCVTWWHRPVSPLAPQVLQANFKTFFFNVFVLFCFGFFFSAFCFFLL